MSTQSELIQQVLRSALHLQKAVYKNLNIPRSYGGDTLLYMREAHLLNALGDADRMLTAEELAESLDITHGAVTQLTDRLEKKGYVYRDKSPKDKRKILRGLTPKGIEAYKLHRSFDEEKFKTIYAQCSDFTDEELHTFVRVADRLASSFSSGSDSGFADAASDPNKKKD